MFRLVDTFRQSIASSPFNATDVFLSPRDGLRVLNSVEQLACFEFAATCVSNAPLLLGLEDGGLLRT